MFRLSGRVSAVSDFHILLIYPYGVSVSLSYVFMIDVTSYEVARATECQTKIRLDFGLASSAWHF